MVMISFEYIGHDKIRLDYMGYHDDDDDDKICLYGLLDSVMMMRRTILSVSLKKTVDRPSLA